MEASVWFDVYRLFLTVWNSLVRWVAYWTTGFEMTTNWYWRRIRKNLDMAVVAYQYMLPANRAASSYFFRWWILSSVDNPLSGLRGARQWDYIDWDGDGVFSKFKDYVLDEERKLKTMLRRVSYNIDEDNTLHTLTGGDRPEKVCMSPSAFSANIMLTLHPSMRYLCFAS